MVQGTERDIMNKTCIIHLPPGLVADPKFLKDAVVRFPTVFGFALQHEGELVSEIHNKAWTVEQIEAITAGPTKDGHRLLVFGNWSSYEKDDVMPFLLQDKDNKPFLAIAHEGVFGSFSGMNGKHTDESNVFDEVISPRIDKLVKETGGDMDRLIELLGSDTTERIFKKAYDTRGQYFLLGREGPPIIIGDNSIAKKFSWGHVSNTAEFAYAEKVAEPEKEKKEEPKAAGSFLDKMLGREPKATQPAAGAVADSSVVKPAGTQTSVTLVEVKVPPQLEKSQRNFWLRTFNGKEPNELPSDHQRKDVSVWVLPSMVEYAKRPVKSTKDMRALVQEMKEARASGKLLDFPSATGEKKETKETTAQTGKSTTREPSSNYVNTSTVLDIKDKEKQVNLLADFLSSKKMSPIDIQKLEAKWPQYSDEVGVKFEELLFLTPDQLMKLFDGNKPAVACILQFRRRFIEGTNLKLEDLVSGSKGEEPKDDKQVVVPSASPEPAAATSGDSNPLSFLRRSAA